MWFTETPWPPIYICLGGAAILIGAWYQNRRGAFLAAGCTLAALAPLIFLVERLIVTAREEVEAGVHALVEAVVADDPDRAAEFIGDPTWRKTVRGAMESFRVKDVRVTDVQVREGDEPGTFISHFRANGSVTFKQTGQETTHTPTRWELIWRRDSDGRRRVFHIRRLHFYRDEEIGILSEG